MMHSQVTIQITPTSRPSTPPWLGEVAAFAQVLTHLGVLNAIQEHVRFARPRFGQYDTMDFVVVLIGYALSGEPTLKAYYARLVPFADTFMACFGRFHMPDRSTLSRFLAALDQATVEALRTLFLADMVARTPFATPGELSDRQGNLWWVMDVDGTKQAARQRALPHRKDLPAPHRRMTQVCSPGYMGRKRGEVVRTRTTVLQAFTHQWIGTYGGAGNGKYRGELKRALEAITWYALARSLPLAQMLIRSHGMRNEITIFQANRKKNEWERRTNMRKLWVKAWMTLDGVFDADTMDHWWPPADEAAADYARRIEYIAEEYSKGDVYLLGRTTYEMLWPGWSTQTDTLGSILNRMKKYVVSTTLEIAPWKESTIIRGNVVEAITKLKQQPGKDIIIDGSATLVHSLMGTDLIDEYRFLVVPYIMGRGRRFFPDGTPPTQLRLVSSKMLSGGTLALIYQPDKK